MFISDASGVGALLHAMLPQLASLSFGGGCGPEASTTILSELAQAAGGVLPLHTLCIANVDPGDIAPILGSLRKLRVGGIYIDKGAFESLLAHAQQLQALELQYPPPSGFVWVSPSLQELSFVSKTFGCSFPCLRDVLYGDLPALQEVQIGRVSLSGLLSAEGGAAAVEVLRACLTATRVNFRVCGISLECDEWEDEGEGKVHLQPWLEPLAALFADRTQAACVECVHLAYITVDAGSVHGLASIFPAMIGGAQASSTAIALTALHTELPLACLAAVTSLCFCLWHCLPHP